MINFGLRGRRGYQASPCLEGSQCHLGAQNGAVVTEGAATDAARLVVTEANDGLRGLNGFGVGEAAVAKQAYTGLAATDGGIEVAGLRGIRYVRHELIS